MIHITSATSGTKIYIPCNKGKDAGNSYTLTLASEEYGFVANWSVEDTGNTNDYFVCVVDFSDVKDGEYIYNLDNGNGNWANGLMRFGDQKQGVFEYDVTPTYYEYNPETGESQVIGGLHTIDLDVEYTENGDYTIDTPDNYDGIGKVNVSVNVNGGGECRVQEKEVAGTLENMHIVPDAGYDCISEVNVDMSEVRELVNEQFVSGRTYQKSLLASTAITENGGYFREDGFSMVVVNVSGSSCNLQEKSAVIEDKTGTILPDAGYDGLSKVSYDASSVFDSGYTEGYNEGEIEGYEQGEADQKAKLISTAITSNGTYTRENGYNSVEVNVPQTILQSTAFTTNGSYIQEEGYAWSEVDVNVDTQGAFESGYTSGYTEGYNSGYTDGSEDGFESGETHQKSLLVSTAITENGLYEKEDGYNSVNVNINTQAYWNSGYTSGYTEGFESGHTAGEAEQKAKLVSTAITENGTYIREDGWNEVNVSVDNTVICSYAEYIAMPSHRDDIIYLITCDTNE